MRIVSRFLADGVTATDRHRIIRGTLHSFLIQGFSVALVFASNWWLVRSSNPEAYGNYVHVFNWVSILSVLVMGGRDDLVLAQLLNACGAGTHRQYGSSALDPKGQRLDIPVGAGHLRRLSRPDHCLSPALAERTSLPCLLIYAMLRPSKLSPPV